MLNVLNVIKPAIFLGNAVQKSNVGTVSIRDIMSETAGTRPGVNTIRGQDTPLQIVGEEQTNSDKIFKEALVLNPKHKSEKSAA